MTLLTKERWVEIVRIIFCGIMIFLFSQEFFPLRVLWATVAIGLYPLLKTGLLDLIRERKVGTEIFVVIATLIAIFGGETIAGAVLMVIILIAEFIADLNTDRARASIHHLLGSVPSVATLRNNGTDHVVPIAVLKVHDIVLVRAGETIPVDGTVMSGSGVVNEAPITGESVPLDKTLRAVVFAGTILESGALDIRTDRIGADTTFARIIKLVEGAEESQAPVQKLADKVAAWLVPVSFLFIIVVFMLTHNVRTIVTLMIFLSPAELGLATPMVMIAAVARAARSGILVKGGIFLETLAKVDTVVFDKTGTLTLGKATVEKVIALTNEFSEHDVLTYAATANRRSAHPLAKAVVAYASTQEIVTGEPTHFEVVEGRGVRATIRAEVVLVGNKALLMESNIAVPPQQRSYEQTEVYVAVNGRLIGALHVADQIRPEAKEAITKLKATGVTRVVMLTGDNTTTAHAVAEKLGIDTVYAELLPEDKLRIIKELQAGGRKVVMVGDGVNDAPALAQADVGIAMGAEGTQAALEAADVALMTSDLTKIMTARSIARAAYRTIQQNLFVGVGVVHVAGIIAALTGIIGPVQAALIHLGPDILVFLNSVRLLKVKI